MAALKWHELPTDPAQLREMYEKLKDKEMRLEADLAIKEHPEVEEGITRVALALSDVKKLDQSILKAEKPDDEASRREVEALVNRAAHLRNQLEVAESQLREKAGKAGDRMIDLRRARDVSFQQLIRVFKAAEKVFEEHSLDLAKIIPSISDFVASKKSEMPPPETLGRLGTLAQVVTQPELSAPFDPEQMESFSKSCSDGGGDRAASPAPLPIPNQSFFNVGVGLFGVKKPQETE
jgi:hypothetical protein